MFASGTVRAWLRVVCRALLLGAAIAAKIEQMASGVWATTTRCRSRWMLLAGVLSFAQRASAEEGATEATRPVSAGVAAPAAENVAEPAPDAGEARAAHSAEPPAEPAAEPGVESAAAEAGAQNAAESTVAATAVLVPARPQLIDPYPASNLAVASLAPRPAEPAREPSGGATPVEHTRVFLACHIDAQDACQLDELRRLLERFSIVRDAAAAAVEVHIAREETATGGHRYTVRSWGREAPADVQRRSFEARASDTPASYRPQLQHAVLGTMYGVLADTDSERDFQLSLEPRSAVSGMPAADPWSSWVLSAWAGVNGQGESLYHSVSLSGGLSAIRSTPGALTRLQLDYEYAHGRYSLGDEQRFSAHSSGAAARARQAWSVGRHWSTGGLLTLQRSEYDNLALSLRVAPAVELSLWPYQDAAERQLRLIYQAGAWLSRYFEPTLLGRRSDMSAFHALSIVLDLDDTRGGIQWIMQARQFWDRPTLYRLGTTLSATVNLVGGFAATLAGSAARVHDQLSLARDPPSEAEAVLDMRQLPKSFEYGYELTLSYTFGSSSEGVVNPRFGQVDLDAR